MLQKNELRYIENNISFLSHATPITNLESILQSDKLTKIYNNDPTSTKVFTVPLYKNDKTIENRACILQKSTNIELLLSTNILNDVEFYISRIAYMGNLEQSLYFSSGIRDILEQSDDVTKFKYFVKYKDTIPTKYKRTLYKEADSIMKNNTYKSSLSQVLRYKRIYEIGIFSDISISKYLVKIQYYDKHLEKDIKKYKKKYPHIEFAFVESGEK